MPLLFMRRRRRSIRRTPFPTSRWRGRVSRSATGRERTSGIGMNVESEHARAIRSEEHTSELQSRLHLVCRLLLEKKKKQRKQATTLPSKLDPNRSRTARVPTQHPHIRILSRHQRYASHPPAQPSPALSPRAARTL